VLSVLTVFDVTERRAEEDSLKASLVQKEVLLREVHHRVKNNLASIIGLIDLQRSAIQEPDAVKMLVELSERIRSMSLVHEKLYHSESLSIIDCQDYLDDLIFQLRCSYESRDVHFDVTAAGVEMPLDSAVPCALIINELVTNALKYAFPDKRSRTGNGECRISVCLTRGDPHSYTLSVADNGVGLPAGLEWTKTKTLGLLLVKMLGQHQLGGTYELNQDQGTRFTLTFAVRTGRSHHE
jgi:two-component sensor histidine kinase